MKKLDESFYMRDTLTVAKELVGKYIVNYVDGEKIVARIIETEAYLGVIDRASHAFGGRKTERTSTMYMPGGIAYVYLIYGMYKCLNAVTEEEGNPCAVLIRSGEIVEGFDKASALRYGKPYSGLDKIQIKNMLNGPGKLCKGLGILMEYNRASLCGEYFYICDDGKALDFGIGEGERINIDYALSDKDKPWRFFKIN
ncbi:MAG: DNA-3-methyladenine glycosylase [Lachnospiraceae bacterium]|nr:DNA-3-methyladenine glycosylase [Lachnospiraceae bacterium]